MKTITYVRTSIVLSLAGTLFSGYLSAQKLFTGTCAFNESCPYFFGYPSCWYGFALFLTMFIIAMGIPVKMLRVDTVIRGLTIVSFAGILFSGFFTAQDLPTVLSGEVSYSLGLPTCAYGLVFYVAIFILSFRQGGTRRVG